MSTEEALTPPFSALLLAGGRSRRMGRDKALLEWGGRPLWEVQAAKLASLQPQRLLIACREEQGLHHSQAGRPFAAVEWLFDPPGEDLGPMAAIVRALGTDTGMPLLVLAVDMPWVTADFLRNDLLGADRGLFFQGPHGYEPLAGIYVPAMRAGMAARLQRGRLGLQAAIEEAVAAGDAVVKPAPVDAELLFQNANTQEEWEFANAARG